MVYLLNVVVQSIPDQAEFFRELGIKKKGVELLWKEAYGEGGRNNTAIPKIPWGLLPQRNETLKRFLKSAEELLEEGKPSAAVPLLEVVAEGVCRTGISYGAIGTSRYALNIMLKKAYVGSVMDYLLKSNCDNPVFLEAAIGILQKAWEIGLDVNGDRNEEEVLEFFHMSRVSEQIEAAQFWLRGVPEVEQAKQALTWALEAAQTKQK
jgi:hypothetical protein